MKKIFFVIFGFVLILLLTCPSEKTHKDAICLSINRAIDEKLGDADFSWAGIMNYGSKIIIKNVANLLVESNLNVENYYLFSVGRNTFDNGKVVSVGVLNHVFTFNKDDILEEIEKRGF